MPRARVWPTTGFQRVGHTLLSRVKHNGELITQAGIAGMTVTVKRFSGGDNPVTYGPAGLIVAQSVYDELQVDGRWRSSPNSDNIGYNCAVSLPPEAFPEEDEYWVIVVFDPASGSDFIQIARVTILSNLGAIA